MVDRPDYPGAPRWVKVLGTLLALIVIVFLLALVAKGPHGPQMHAALEDGLRDYRERSYG